ncbi:MAG: molybdopterin-dependent oxidoreductase [Deltaproteobacteria bacterium]|nr:molybdopterin-dependent oxidoreductase [Deltaproteobacteria bacterium]
MAEERTMGEGKSNEQPGTTAASVDRRDFLKVTGTVAAAAALLPAVLRESTASAAPDPTEDDTDVVFIHSTCQMCHSRCGIKAKVLAGQLLKIDGNPWHPNNRGEDERLTYATTPAAARTQFGRLCPKGQAGVQTLYDPLRIQHPLKRVGARGSGRWETITWTQAFTEIAARVNALIPFSSRNTTNIDDGSVDLGKIANQLILSPGRSIEKSVSERVFKTAYGSVNYGIDHTSICEVSHHTGNEYMTLDHVTAAQGPNHFKTDMLKAEYMIVFGGNPVEANFPMLALARLNADMRDLARAGGPGRVVIVDPRFSNSAAKADTWVPIRPGGDSALALGMARVILGAGTYNAAYLRLANKAAATAATDSTYTDATWLVIVQPGHANQGKFLTAAEAGLSAPLDAANPVCVRDSDGVTIEAAVRGTSPAAAVGRLEPGAGSDTVVNGIACRTAFELYRGAVFEHSLHEYATLCGVSETTITTLATDFTSHGRKASAWTYRGAVQHTNGTYTQLSVMALNWLIGNVDWAGGLAKGGGGWSEVTATGGVDTAAVTGAPTRVGPRMDRAKGSVYNSTKSYYVGYPTPRPWFPFGSHGVFQELIPSIEDAYPYPAKVLFTYWNAWPYSVPGGKATWERTVSDEVKLPLFVAISPVMGEVAAWADYVLPDTTFLEKWSFPGGTPTILTKFTPFQQPVVGAYDGTVIGGTGTWSFNPTATNAYTPFLPDTMMYADILINLAKAISTSFPGVGASAFGAAGGLDRAWDMFKHQVNNAVINVGTSIGGAAITAADFIARGGAFANPGTSYDTANPNLLNSKYGGVLHFYVPAFATTTDSITGVKYRGTANWTPISHCNGVPVDDPAYPMQLVTYKSVLHGQGRTNVNPWLMVMQPQNYVDLAVSDARTLGIETGDRVRIVSVSNPSGVVGTARVIEGQRPGVVAVMHHFGHWEQSSRPHAVDGTATSFDQSRGSGLTVNPVMRLDDYLGNVSLQDPIGGSVSFNDTRVRVEPAS